MVVLTGGASGTQRRSVAPGDFVAMTKLRGGIWHEYRDSGVDVQHLSSAV